MFERIRASVDGTRTGLVSTATRPEDEDKGRGKGVIAFDREAVASPFCAAIAPGPVLASRRVFDWLLSAEEGVTVLDVVVDENDCVEEDADKDGEGERWANPLGEPFAAFAFSFPFPWPGCGVRGVAVCVDALEPDEVDRAGDIERDDDEESDFRPVDADTDEF